MNLTTTQEAIMRTLHDWGAMTEAQLLADTAPPLGSIAMSERRAAIRLLRRSGRLSVRGDLLAPCARLGAQQERILRLLRGKRRTTKDLATTLGVSRPKIRASLDGLVRLHCLVAPVEGVEELWEFCGARCE